MSNNPFDDENGTFYVLVNEEEQYCLWPTFAQVPGGWTIALQESSRIEAIAFVEREWDDLRPRSLREAMASTGATGAS